MSAFSSRRPCMSSRPAQGTSLGVVLASEDEAAAARCARLCERLSRRLAHEFLITKSTWEFDSLRDPACRQAARRDVAQADMIVLAVHGGTALPEEVRIWLECCRTGGRNDRSIALAVLLDDTPDPLERGPLWSYLHELTRSARLHLLIHRASRDESLVVPPGEQEPPPHPWDISIPASDDLNQPRQHWGINE